MSLTRPPTAALDRLRALRLFAGCSDKDLARVDRLTCAKDVDAGTVLCRQGAVGRQTFVIVSGQAEVAIDGAVIATLGPSSFFGELSVLDGDPRVATVTAITPMTLLVLSPRELQQLLADLPSVARRVLVTVGGRLRLANRARLAP
jgi:CRP-like cAMP-binding protein